MTNEITKEMVKAVISAYQSIDCTEHKCGETKCKDCEFILDSIMKKLSKQQDNAIQTKSN